MYNNLTELLADQSKITDPLAMKNIFLLINKYQKMIDDNNKRFNCNEDMPPSIYTINSCFKIIIDDLNKLI
jgi:hypothetical protein